MRGVGALHTLRTDLDLERRTSYRLALRVERTIKGKGESEVTLPSGKKATKELFNDKVTGYDAKGRVAVTITIEEPTYERPSAHYNSI